MNEHAPCKIKNSNYQHKTDSSDRCNLLSSGFGGWGKIKDEKVLSSTTLLLIFKYLIYKEMGGEEKKIRFLEKIGKHEPLKKNVI